MKIYWISSFLFFLILVLTNCAESSQNNQKTILFPNNDSELTLLMREMFDYYEGLKTDVENGNLPKNIREFAEIHSAVATDPVKSNSDLYKAMSTVYLQSAERLNTSTENVPEIFNAMIDNCMNCHQQMCPGPMVKIKKLYVKGASRNF